MLPTVSPASLMLTVYPVELPTITMNINRVQTSRIGRIVYGIILKRPIYVQVTSFNGC